MKVRLVGTRGSVARAGPDTVRYGGDTSAVEVTAADGTILIIDAGTGLPRIEPDLAGHPRIDILLSHLHFDHIQGLGFFSPLFNPNCETHIWGPISTTMGLRERLARYLSPPLFPVRLRDLPNLHLHDVGPGQFTVGPFAVSADLICHPGPTLGFRIEDRGATLAYLSDHEPALGDRGFPPDSTWLSGADLAMGAHVLIHDTQYTTEEYLDRQGWGHSTLRQAIAYAAAVGAERLVTFHHEPGHGDTVLDQRIEEARGRLDGELELIPGTSDLTLEV